MCGRFTLRTPPHLLAEVFELLREPDLQPRSNIAPTQPVAVVRRMPAGRELSLMRWGLVPSWSNTPKPSATMINARAESLAEKPAFRTAFRRRRCLIPADGFYEWKKTGPKTKQPYRIGLADGDLFAFAGLWEAWHQPDGGVLESCTIITTAANGLVAHVHDRMPVILARNEHEVWVDPETSLEALETLLDPFPPDRMALQTVSNEAFAGR